MDAVHHPQPTPETPAHGPPPPPPPQSALAIASSHAPELPTRPDVMSMEDPSHTAYNPAFPMQNPAMSSFSNRYAGYGGYGGGGMYGGGMGSYGGGYGSSYGGYNRFGAASGGMYGGGDPYGNVGPGGNPTWSSQLQNQTMPAFAVLESLVTAFSSLAQLFESTYAATHSSFFAMVGVADQLGGLKSYLGQVLGLFSIVRLGKKLVAWLRGTAGHSSSAGNGGWAEEWKIGQALDRSSRHPSSSPSGGGGGKPSAKPLLWFFVSAIGLPYLMTKLVRLLTELQRRRMELAAAAGGAAGHIPTTSTGGTVPSNSLTTTGPSAVATTTTGGQPLLFARTIWPFEGTSAHELTLKRDEIVAVLQQLPAPTSATSTTTKGGEAAGWWRGRTRDGRVGWFPGNYVEPLRRKEEAQLATPPQDTKGAGDSFVGA